jgi:hypothetical protein
MRRFRGWLIMTFRVREGIEPGFIPHKRQYLCKPNIKVVSRFCLAQAPLTVIRSPTQSTISAVRVSDVTQIADSDSVCSSNYRGESG